MLGKSKVAPKERFTIVELELLTLRKLTKIIYELQKILCSKEITIWSG